MELNNEEEHAAMELPILDKRKKWGDMVKTYKCLNRFGEVNTEQLFKMDND